MSSNAYRKCAKCGATSAEDNSVQFHRFPKAGITNILRATFWATYCWPKHDWSSVESLASLYKRNKVLCGRHFQDSCYTNSSKKRLSMYAVPGTTEYVVKTMKQLRSKLSLNVQRTKNTNSSQDSLVAGCSTLPKVSEGRAQQEASVVDQNIFEVKTTHDAPTAGCSTDPGASVDRLQQDTGVVKQPTMMDTAEPNPSQEPKKARKKGSQKEILKALNKCNISELSESEKKLYNICRNKINTIQKLRKKIRTKTKLNKIKTICDNVAVQKLFDLNLSDSFVSVVQSQLMNYGRKLQGRRYNLEQKLLALTLYKKSPACYRLLRRIFSLPCQSTLNKLLNKVPLMPGINEHVFNGLKAMTETLTEDDTLCTLVFDEMAIRKHLNYNPKSDCVDGFQDHANHGRTEAIACSALVFMICGLRKKWKQPIAYYLSTKSVTSDRLSVIIKEILTKCFHVGLNIVATVCDLCSVNSKALRILGATAETPYFLHDNREIVTVADPPHLLKCLRNMFLAHNITFPSAIQPDEKLITGTAKWVHIEQFYELDKMNPNFVYAPALTERHIRPNTKQKMRVKLAAQVFSHTVTAGILAKIATNELPAVAQATATLLQKFDQLFDALNANSTDLRRGKKFSTNLTSRSPHLNYFLEMKKFIKNMHFVNARNPPSQSGWIQTINAVERLFRNLTRRGIHSLSTRSLNQDPLENFFGCVRYNCGSNYNPTISQFVAGLKTAIITNLKNTGKNKNCEDDEGILSNNLKSFLIEPVAQMEPTPPVTEKEDKPDTSLEECEPDTYLEEYEPDTSKIEALSSEIQACAYVCGFVVKKLNNRCEQCTILLTCQPGSEPAHIFTQFKEYDEFKHSLNYASMPLIGAVEKAASLAKSYLSENIWKNKIKERGMLLLKTECKESFIFLKQCPVHYKKNYNEILWHVLAIVLKRYLILTNRDLSEEASKRALQRKLNILKNK